MTTDKRNDSFAFLAPHIAQDLALKEVCAILKSPRYKEQARELLARRPVRMILLYSVSGVLCVALFVGGIWAGAWLMGLPLSPGEELRQVYPLSFLVTPHLEPWFRYVCLVSVVGFASAVRWPFGWLRRKLVNAWAEADAAKQGGTG